MESSCFKLVAARLVSFGLECLLPKGDELNLQTKDLLASASISFISSSTPAAWQKCVRVSIDRHLGLRTGHVYEFMDYAPPKNTAWWTNVTPLGYNACQDKSHPHGEATDLDSKHFMACRLNRHGSSFPVTSSRHLILRNPKPKSFDSRGPKRLKGWKSDVGQSNCGNPQLLQQRTKTYGTKH